MHTVHTHTANVSQVARAMDDKLCALHTAHSSHTHIRTHTTRSGQTRWKFNRLHLAWTCVRVYLCDLWPICGNSILFLSFLIFHDFVLFCFVLIAFPNSMHRWWKSIFIVTPNTVFEWANNRHMKYFMPHEAQIFFSFLYIMLLVVLPAYIFLLAPFRVHRTAYTLSRTHTHTHGHTFDFHETEGMNERETEEKKHIQIALDSYLPYWGHHNTFIKTILLLILILPTPNTNIKKHEFWVLSPRTNTQENWKKKEIIKRGLQSRHKTLLI